jgi:hypothetical protein
MKNLKILVAMMSVVILSSFSNMKQINPQPLKHTQSFLTSSLSIYSVVSGATITKITWDDQFNNATFVNNPNPSTWSASPIADENEITVRITGSFTAVALRTADQTTTIEQQYFHSGNNNYTFSVSLSSGSYAISVD